MTSALDELYDALCDELEPSYPGIELAFGWRARQEHEAAGVRPRVVLTPGDDSESVAADAPLSVTSVTESGARILGVVQQLARLTITAPADPRQPESERHQWRPTYALALDVWSAILRIGGGAVERISMRYLPAPARQNSTTIVMTIGVLDTIEECTDGSSRLVQAQAHVELRQLELTDVFDAPIEAQ